MSKYFYYSCLTFAMHTVVTRLRAYYQAAVVFCYFGLRANVIPHRLFLSTFRLHDNGKFPKADIHKRNSHRVVSPRHCLRRCDKGRPFEERAPQMLRCLPTSIITTGDDWLGVMIGRATRSSVTGVLTCIAGSEGVSMTRLNPSIMAVPQQMEKRLTTTQMLLADQLLRAASLTTPLAQGR